LIVVLLFNQASSALASEASVCSAMLPGRPMPTKVAEEQIWTLYWRGPGSTHPRPPSIAILPIACRVAREHEGPLEVAAKAVFSAAQTSAKRRPEDLEELLSNIERTGFNEPPGEERNLVTAMDCAQGALDVLRREMNSNPQLSKLLPRLTSVANAYTEAYRCATKSGKRQDRRAEAERREHERTSERKGPAKGEPQSPRDQATALRRRAAEFLQDKKPQEAVQVLEQAVKVLAAFGQEDADTKEASLELDRARNILRTFPEQPPLPSNCHALLQGETDSPKETLDALRRYYTLVQAGVPVPPVLYGAACRALRGETDFRNQTWANPLVTEPMMRAAEQSLRWVPPAAALDQARELVDGASRLGTGPAPAFSWACSESLLRFAERLAKRSSDSRIQTASLLASTRQVRERFKAAQRCGLKATATH
jgi:hypothetical protein